MHARVNVYTYIYIYIESFFIHTGFCVGDFLSSISILCCIILFYRMLSDHILQRLVLDIVSEYYIMLHCDMILHHAYDIKLYQWMVFYVPSCRGIL